MHCPCFVCVCTYPFTDSETVSLSASACLFSRDICLRRHSLDMLEIAVSSMMLFFFFVDGGLLLLLPARPRVHHQRPDPEARGRRWTADDDHVWRGPERTSSSGPTLAAAAARREKEKMKLLIPLTRDWKEAIHTRPPLQGLRRKENGGGRKKSICINPKTAALAVVYKLSADRRNCLAGTRSQQPKRFHRSRYA